jgi:CRP/FNR family cyclic AMP-dependent transcriptional regulator
MRTYRLTHQDAKVVSRDGWLSLQPVPFRELVLERSVTQAYAAGEAVYHLGDPEGGIYGLVAGVLMVTAAPGTSMPRLIHVASPGLWTGEGPFLMGGPRRVALRAAVACRLLHLPLDVMEQMAAEDPAVFRKFGQIPFLNIELLLRVVRDLLIRDPDRRIAAVLLRATAGGLWKLPLSQEAIGDMASASRKQVNFALGRFADSGWLVRGYRAVELVDAASMAAFVAEEG